MKKDIYKVYKMDCPSEEQLIRMKLDVFTQITKLQFDIPNRELTVYHTGNTTEIERHIATLNLSSSLIQSIEVDSTEDSSQYSNDRKLLWAVFVINACFFVVEIFAGILSDSIGLLADALDMLADAIVYGMSLMVISSTMSRKKLVAKLSGVFQLTLAVFGIIEVLRRFLGYEETPEFHTMIFISLFALLGNAASLYLLQKSRSKDAHMQASYIFTSNDVIANIGVIVAGIAVYFTRSSYPDLIIGMIVFLIVARGAFRIISISRSS